MDVVVTVGDTRVLSRMPAGRARQLGPEPRLPASRSPPVVRPARRDASSTRPALASRTHADRPARAPSVRALRHPRVAVATARREPVRVGKIAGRVRPCSVVRLAARLPDVLPLVRLQFLAFAHGARTYSEAFSDAGDLADDLDDGRAGARIARDRPRPRHGARVGRELALAAAAAPRILPILPIVVPAIASVLGWSFLLSPHPGYLNALLRHLPWWSGHFTRAPSTSTRCRGSSSSPASRSRRSSTCSSAPASRTSTPS